MSKCWVIVSEDATPLGIELDYWLKDEADKAFDNYLKDYPFAEFFMYEVVNKDEDNEKWFKVSYREGAWPKDDE